MKRRHNMPYGAEYQQDGSVRFRLWAPKAHAVELHLADELNSIKLALNQCDEGWFELTTDAASPGSLYRFRIDHSLQVPDFASRYQPQDVHGPSEVVDPEGFEWQDTNWRGRPWKDAVIYELHVGSFTAGGKFSSICEKLDYLADLGVTAIELMPVADFPGHRNWGYDGVLAFAPDSSYGRPEDLKNLVQDAHARGLMVLLDVVYNHFGPEGNYLHAYAPQFFTDRHKTPWGNGINFDGLQSRLVRDFFIHNALYWLNEFHFDGLRLDAVHAILDDSIPHFLVELADRVRSGVDPERHIHLILENDNNQASYLQQTKTCQTHLYNAQWNDDIHHAIHVLVTGEKDGYYVDYSQRPIHQLGRCVTEGFAYQGEVSLLRDGKKRGEPSRGLSPTCFISFLQNHDQIGNRAYGERIATLAGPQALKAAAAIMLLAPSPPLLFMGEEFGTETPFLFFCDFEKGLAEAVAAGRRNEFARFARFSDPEARAGIPDPNLSTTFERSRLDWNDLEKPQHQDWLRFYRHLLALRREHIVPRLAGACRVHSEYSVLGDSTLRGQWKFDDGSSLILLANLGADPVPELTIPAAFVIYSGGYASEEPENRNQNKGTLPGWSVTWFLQR